MMFLLLFCAFPILFLLPFILRIPVFQYCYFPFFFLLFRILLIDSLPAGICLLLFSCRRPVHIDPAGWFRHSLRRPRRVPLRHPVFLISRPEKILQDILRACRRPCALADQAVASVTQCITDPSGQSIVIFAFIKGNETRIFRMFFLPFFLLKSKSLDIFRGAFFPSYSKRKFCFLLFFVPT
jgi:hypothetical protein